MLSSVLSTCLSSPHCTLTADACPSEREIEAQKGRKLEAFRKGYMPTPHGLSGGSLGATLPAQRLDVKFL